MRTALIDGAGSTYREVGDRVLIAVDERLSTAEMLAELSHLTTQVANVRWLPPEEMRPGPNAILFYEDPAVAEQIEFEIVGLDLHYRLRPGLGSDTALKAAIDAIAAAADSQGWQTLDEDHRAAG